MILCMSDLSSISRHHTVITMTSRPFSTDKTNYSFHRGTWVHVAALLIVTWPQSVRCNINMLITLLCHCIKIKKNTTGSSWRIAGAAEVLHDEMLLPAWYLDLPTKCVQELAGVMNTYILKRALCSYVCTVSNVLCLLLVYYVQYISFAVGLLTWFFILGNGSQCIELSFTLLTHCIEFFKFNTQVIRIYCKSVMWSHRWGRLHETYWWFHLQYLHAHNDQ